MEYNTYHSFRHGGEVGHIASQTGVIQAFLIKFSLVRRIIFSGEKKRGNLLVLTAATGLFGGSDRVKGWEGNRVY